ncbi:MAG TPA: hypothetical protein VIU12_00025 [Chryseolinea sp.]
MYLAGTSSFMVSPSEIVDTVWHQHLIFTKSYADFCEVIGKTIQHIPSTHNREDFEKFHQAKERTKKFYAGTFGQQPSEIWEYAGMYEALNLPKSRFKIRTFVIFGILTMVASLVPFYFLLRPIYVHINNPYFIIGYFFSISAVYIGLTVFNYFYLTAIVKAFERCTFIHNLAPMELVYLKTRKLANVIHGHVSQLVDAGSVAVTQKDRTLKLGSIKRPESIEEYTIFEALKHSGPVQYTVLLQQLMGKPAFSNISNSMDAFKKYFTKSTAFGRLFYVNFAVYAFAIMLGLTRLSTGLTRGKPVDVLLVLLFIMTAMAVSQLLRLTKLVCINTIPRFYKNEILPKEQNRDAWGWRFFLLGPPVLSASIAPLVESYDASLYRDSSSGWGSSDSSSCGSSCGSSCSSCGGCGGD